MNLKIDTYLYDFVEKYPFFGDPIVLFRPEKLPSREEILSGYVHVEYPEIAKVRSQILDIQRWFEELLETYHQTEFDNDFLKHQYYVRLEDFASIIRLVEIFYDDDESEKYRIINQYYGIDPDALGRIYDLPNMMTEFFGWASTPISIPTDDATLGPRDIWRCFDRGVEYLGLQDCWKIVIQDAVAIVHTNFTRCGGELLVPSHRNMPMRTLINLMSHELDGHCQQMGGEKDYALLSGAVRFPRSEQLIEGLALYMEHMTDAVLFWFSGSDRYKNRVKRLRLLTREIDLDEYISDLDLTDPASFRAFRGFSHIDQYQNLKDFVYPLWLYEVIKRSQRGEDVISTLLRGCVNSEYLDRECIISEDNHYDITQTSGYHVWQKYFQ